MIFDLFYVVGNFRSRSDYMAALKRDLCFCYNYNEFLMERLADMFPVGELLEYIEGELRS